MLHRSIILHLSLLENVGPASIQKIVAGISLENLSQIYQFTARDFEILGISQKTAQILVDGLANNSLLEKELELCQKYGIEWLTLFDEDYPALLKEIYLPPAVLYYQGNKELLYKPSLAIVGSRKANAYARVSIDKIVKPLVHNFVIVSGGALGADTMAHQVALEQKGSTIAALGSGLLKPYPSLNKKLFQDIVAKNGLLISPFSVLTDPHPGNFPARNRIIAGLSQGCLVVQAAQKSGAIITAHYALEQGRDVFAIPGPLDDFLSVGCNTLIAQGAFLVQSAQDIVRLLSGEFYEEKTPELISIPKDDPKEEILRACRQPLSLEQLQSLETITFSHNELLVTLFDLQVQGKIEQNFMGLWQTL